MAPVGLIAASAAHAVLLTAIHRGSLQSGDAWGPEVFARQLGLPGAFGLVDARGGLIVARVAADEAEILTLAVLPTWRGQGLGTALLHGAMTESVGRHATVMFLEVSIGNRAALALYERLGFRRVGRRQRYYSDGMDALVLKTELGLQRG